MEDPTQPERASSVKAWVNVIYGCNERCSYCVVPTTRGVEQSRPRDAIRAEIDKWAYSQDHSVAAFSTFSRSTTIGLCQLYGPGAHRRVWEKEKMKKPRPGLNVTLGRHGDAKRNELADEDTEKNGASTQR